MANFTKFGNDLYTGKKSINIVGRRRVWYVVAAVLIVASVVGPWLRGGFEFGIEFRGGSQFLVERTAILEQEIGEDAVRDVVANAAPRVSVIGTDSMRIQTDAVEAEEATQIRAVLAENYEVALEQVNYSLVGPTWGANITEASIRALVVFLLLAGVVMALYFRTWKMSVAALTALFHDLIITAGIYGILGFEVTPAAVIGFLTILGYSLYDTVVVFDKIRENTAEDGDGSSRTFAESVNLAVNQTLVRSINTSVVAVLPVAAILFIGSFALGAQTLRDISLALFIGIIVGAYSTIFIAAPVYNHLRSTEPTIKKQNARLAAERSPETVAAP